MEFLSCTFHGVMKGRFADTEVRVKNAEAE
jgi:hypothetical protein